MAKSIYETLASSTFTVEHGMNKNEPNETHEFETPTWLQDFTVEVMQDEEALLKVCDDHNILHGLLHLGLQQAIIAMRAKTRPSDIKTVKQSMTGTQTSISEAQNRLDAYLPAPIKVPGAAKPVTESAALKALKDAGFSAEAIAVLLASKEV